jgi:TP901 family phage tail tape measure protein
VTSVGYATLSVIPSARGFGAALAGQISAPIAAAGQTAGAQAATGFGARFAAGARVLALGAGVGIGAAVVAGIGAAKIGETFDEAFDTIRTGTGATGDVLEGLKDSFRDVVSTVPTDFESASTAIADLNTRLGLTGDDLEGLSAQMLELSRITGSDLSRNIESVSRVFGDWGIAVEDQGPRLDALFRASQATGIGVDQLGEQMVKFGAPLRQLGFGFDQTAALLGQFEKEGVNAELVMGSMRIALGKMARDGEPAQETLARITEEIANAGSASEANALALELFGARAGPDMAAAIREGRFEVGELLDVVSNGSETILGAAADTNDWRESWTLFKNRILVGLEPLARSAFDAMGTAMDKLGPIVLNIASYLTDRFFPALVSVGRWIADNQPVLIGLATVIGVALTAAFVTWGIAAWGAAAGVIAATWPVLALGLALGALVAGLVWAYQNVGWFRAAVQATASFLTDTAWPILQQIARVVGRVLVRAFEVATAVVMAHVAVLRTLWRWAQQVWDRSEGLRGFLVGAFVAGLGLATGAVDRIVGAFRTAWRWAKSLWDRTEGLRGFLADLFTVGVQTASTAIGALWLAMNRAWRWARSLWDRTEGLRSFLAGAFEVGVSTATDIIDGLREGFDKAADAVGWVIDKVQDLIDWINKIPSVPDLTPGFDVPFLASGGFLPRGRLAVVGEEGPELVAFGRDARVFSNPDSVSIASRADTGGGGRSIVINNHRSAAGPTEISRGIRMARLSS